MKYEHLTNSEFGSSRLGVDEDELLDFNPSTLATATTTPIATTTATPASSVFRIGSQFTSPPGLSNRVIIDGPRYFYVIKYFLLGYIVIHLAYITITLPSGMRELKETEHEHREQILALWITSIVYCGITSIGGFYGICKEIYAICFIFSISMVINLILLVYAALLHLDQGTSLITALVTNWFFTAVVIAFTKILDNRKNHNFSHLLESSPGYLHNIYIRQEPKEMQQQIQMQ